MAAQESTEREDLALAGRLLGQELARMDGASLGPQSDAVLLAYYTPCYWQILRGGPIERPAFEGAFLAGYHAACAAASQYGAP